MANNLKDILTRTSLAREVLNGITDLQDNHKEGSFLTLEDGPYKVTITKLEDGVSVKVRSDG